MFSLDKLVNMLARLGDDVELIVKAHKDNNRTPPGYEGRNVEAGYT